MIGLGSVIVLAAGFQVISSQGPEHPNFPQECRGPPRNVQERPHECCKIPPFFTDEDFKECGFQKLDGPGPGPQHRHGPPDCSKQLCMLKKYELLKDETDIDHEALAAYMDKWAETNELFQAPIATAKERCVGKQLPGPPHICEANKMVFCISSTLFSECPAWEQTEGCKSLKEHLDLCKPFFQKA